MSLRAVICLIVFALELRPDGRPFRNISKVPGQGLGPELVPVLVS